MAKRAFGVQSWTTGTGTADAGTYTTLQFQGLQGGGATQVLQVVEIMANGQASASAIAPLLFRRASTAGATLTALASPNSDGFMNSQSTAISTAPGAYVAATTLPVASNVTTLARLNLGLNLFGGIVRWVAAPNEEWWILGNVASADSQLGTYTGGNSGTIGTHIIYEVI